MESFPIVMKMLTISDLYDRMVTRLKGNNLITNNLITEMAILRQ